MSVHISGDGLTGMPLKLIRRFVEATANYPEDTRVEAGVVGLTGTSVDYTTLQGLQTRGEVKR